MVVPRVRFVWFLLLVGVLAGCGSAPPETIRVTDPPERLAALDLDRPLAEPGGFFADDRWPSACDLVDDEALRAVFPQATDIVRTPRTEDLRVTTRAAGVLGRRLGERTVSIPGLTCTTRFSLPGAIAEPDDETTGATIRTRVVAAGDPAAVVAAAPLDRDGTEPRRGGRCERNPATRECLEGPLRFTVAFTPPVADDIDDPLTYTVGTTTRTFERFAGRERLDFTRNEVDPRLADAVLARVG